MNRSIRLAAGAFAALLCLTLAGCRGKQAIGPARGPQQRPHRRRETAQTAETAALPVAQTASAAETPTVLPETADAGRSYVEETLFIGGFQHRALHDVRRRDRHGVYKPLKTTSAW